MATHSSTLAWKIPWMEEPGRLQSMGSKESDTTERLHFNFSLSCIGEGNGNSLQCSCLENPRDGGAWWAAIYGVAQSWTRLKWLNNNNNNNVYLDRWGFLGGSGSKGSACDAGDLSSIPGSGRFPGEGNGNLLQYSCLGNPRDRGAWPATIWRVTKSQTWLSD